MSPADIDKKTEERILSAAYDVFLEKGKNGARMQEIADAAGVNKALLHYYYRSKDKIYRAVFKAVAGELINNIFRDLDMNLPFYDLLRHFISRHIEAIRPRQKIFRFFFSEVWMNSDEVMSIFRDVLKYAGEPIYKALFRRFNKAVEDKEIRKIDPIQVLINIIILDVFYFVLSPIFFTMIDLPDKKRKQIDDQRAEEVIAFVWESVRYRGEEVTG